MFIVAMFLGTAFLVSCGGNDDGVKPDTTPPTVTATYPPGGAVNIRVDTVVTATFSENMQPATINDTTFVVAGITGSVSYADRVATFTPDSDLVSNTVYTATVTTGVKDAAGNSLADAYIWDFTTAAVIMTDGADYFPVADGDTWYYTDGGARKIVRVVSGDTTINGLSCKRILENDTTTEAWSVDSSGFYVHLLDRVLYFIPPLKIPFDLVLDEPYNYNSEVRWIDNPGVFDSISGILKFKGYSTYTVPAGQFDSTIQMAYITDGYSEYYAKGVGLLDNEDYVLDSAYVGGVWYRP
jgi:hypothetical protein